MKVNIDREPLYTTYEGYISVDVGGEGEYKEELVCFEIKKYTDEIEICWLGMYPLNNIEEAEEQILKTFNIL